MYLAYSLRGGFTRPFAFFMFEGFELKRKSEARLLHFVTLHTVTLHAGSAKSALLNLAREEICWRRPGKTSSVRPVYHAAEVDSHGVSIT